MQRLLYAGVLVCLVGGGLAWRFGATPSSFADPEDGRVTHDAYVSAYFDFAYPSPPGWSEGLAGPPPSQSGYYVLGTFEKKDKAGGIILITAQDLFFVADPSASAATMAEDFARSITNNKGMTLERGPSEMLVAGRQMSRVDYNGVGLYRAMIATEIRCHVVSFHLTTRDPQAREALAQSLNAISFGGHGPRSVPPCVRGYAVADNLLKQLQPTAIDARFSKVPVRLIIDSGGTVEHVHVLRASPVQRRNIEEAVGRWVFRPYRIAGRAVEIETGVLFEFQQAGAPAAMDE